MSGNGNDLFVSCRVDDPRPNVPRRSEQDESVVDGAIDGTLEKSTGERPSQTHGDHMGFLIHRLVNSEGQAGEVEMNHTVRDAKRDEL